jgi:uncharacterized membrane protein YfcA
MIFHSSFEYIYLWLPLIGFVIGLWGSMMGGGGGFFLIPVLTVLFNVPVQISVATSLAATLPICIVGTLGHFRKGNINVSMGLTFAFTGILGALTGAKLTSLMTAGQLKISFGIYSILIALLMLIGNWREKRDEANGIMRVSGSRLRKIISGSFFGFVSGVITGTFGTSGTAPVQAGLFAMRMPIKLVVGTSLMVSAVNNFSALGGHFLVGDIDLTLVYFLTAGAIIGALLGPRLLAGVKIGRAEGPIRIWYALGMIVFGIIMIISK